MSKKNKIATPTTVTKTVISNTTATKDVVTSKAITNTVSGLVLLFISLVALALVYGFNKDFIQNKIIQYWSDYKEQRSDLDIDKRKLDRYGGPYYYSQKVAELVKKKVPNNEPILIPSAGYFKANGVDYIVPEPSVFYYLTGIKTIWENCKTNCETKWFLFMKDKQLILDSISTNTQRDSILKEFKKYPASL